MTYELLTGGVFAGLLPPYRTIVADPPWPYNSSGDHLRATYDNRPNSWDSDMNTAGARARYEIMSMDDLYTMPVETLAANDAHLYLWTTNSFMCEAHELARSWGFEPKTILTWVKMKHSEPCEPSMKTGYYFRGATEHVVFAVRGSLPLQVSHGVPTAFMHKRINEHSVKPEAFYDMVEEVSPPLWLDLFARRKRSRWHVWGNEVEERV